MDAHPTRAGQTGTLRIAIDVGGTFTDAAILDEAGRTVRFDKVPTTPQDAALGVLAAFARAGARPESISYFVHGTTLALNALHTRTGAPTPLVTTRGFRDVYGLARTDREVMYDIKYRKAPSLVPRRMTFEVRERMDFQGNVVHPLDAEDLNRVAREVAATGVKAVAVCLLHSYVNPDHEVRVGEAIRRHCPDVEVSLSHELVREYREYERTSTTVIDAYVKPVVRRYLDHLLASLSADGFRGRALVTRSGGGALTFEAAAEKPAHLVLSGPAAGVIGASAFAAAVGQPNLITIDMGGTSLDASLIIGGTPTTAPEASFEGLPISVPSLSINTIGAGGGSVAWIDPAGHMQVGPRSAGAAPGPACYGRGGTQATVTDAALFIGYLGERTALGGEMELRRDLATDALETLAGQLGLDVHAVAHGIWAIVGVHVTGAVREITVEQGHDPADFALLAYGGAGGLIAGDVARQLGIPTVIVPPGPGAFSAFGMLFTDVVHDFTQTRVAELERIDPELLTGLFAQLEERGRAALAADGFAAADTVLIRSADLRFAGQEHSVEVPVVAGTLDRLALESLSEEFARRHDQRYGHRMEDPVEIVTARLRAIGRVTRPELPPADKGDPDRAGRGNRRVYLGATDGWVDYQVLGREQLGRGNVVKGPAIIEEYTATTVVHEGDVCTVGDHGELSITIAQRERRTSRSRRS